LTQGDSGKVGVVLILIPIAFAVAGAVSTRRERNERDAASYLLETRFKDAELLRKALDAYGCKSIDREDTLHSEIDGTRIVFEPRDEGRFDVVFFGRIPFEQATTFLADITDEYTRALQDRVYQRLIDRAKDRGLRLESDAVQEDNSVLLTFTLDEVRR
jgi:hypothetical protein